MTAYHLFEEETNLKLVLILNVPLVMLVVRALDCHVGKGDAPASTVARKVHLWYNLI